MVMYKVDFKDYISGWFLGAPFKQILRGNLEEFYTWAFFARSPDNINAQEALEVKDMIDQTCETLKIEFAPGFTPGLYAAKHQSCIQHSCSGC